MWNLYFITFDKRSAIQWLWRTLISRILKGLYNHQCVDRHQLVEPVKSKNLYCYNGSSNIDCFLFLFFNIRIKMVDVPEIHIDKFHYKQLPQFGTRYFKTSTLSRIFAKVCSVILYLYPITFYQFPENCKLCSRNTIFDICQKQLNAVYTINFTINSVRCKIHRYYTFFKPSCPGYYTWTTNGKFSSGILGQK